MEETIGYEALFSAEEWDTIRSDDWSDVPPDDWGSPEEGDPENKHTVFVAYPPGEYEGNEDRSSDPVDADRPDPRGCAPSPRRRSLRAR